MHFVRSLISKDEFIYITAFTADIIQDTFQGVFFFTKFRVILLILKLFRACRLIHTRALYTTMRIFLKGSDLTLIEDYIIQL